MKVRGFTLLELIVVISILAILSVIAIPPILQYNTNQTLQNAAADLQQSLRTTQSNALSGVVCTDNPSNLASSRWSLVFTDPTISPPSYQIQATCITPTPSPYPVATLSTKTLPAGVEVFEMWVNIRCVNPPPGNGVSFSSISGKVNFITIPGDCGTLTTSQKMWVGLRLTDDNSKTIYVVVEKGGPIYVSSEKPN